MYIIDGISVNPKKSLQYALALSRLIKKVKHKTKTSHRQVLKKTVLENSQKNNNFNSQDLNNITRIVTNRKR